MSVAIYLFLVGGTMIFVLSLKEIKHQIKNLERA
jgi:cell division protein FtsX